MKGISSVLIQILTNWKGFEAFKSKFEHIERDLKHSIENSKHSKGFEAFECKFDPFEGESKHSNANSKHSNAIKSIQMQILINRMGLE